MIDLKTLNELVRLMVDNDLSELDVRDGEETVTLKRGGAHAAPCDGRHHPPPAQAPAPGAPQPSQGGAGVPPPVGGEDEGLVAITSPMVGTFYSASDPDSKPFISVGASVGQESVVCLIEAMKVFNEVKAECAGKVERILVNNGDAVEYGQTLFLVRPA